MLHVFSELSALSTDQEIKDAILANYSDILSSAEVAAKLQNMQIPSMNHWSHSTQDTKPSIEQHLDYRSGTVNSNTVNSKFHLI